MSSESPHAVMSPQWSTMSHRVPHDPEHELEWSIIAESIDDDELHRLRELHSLLDDCDLHPICRRKPLHRQAQTLLRYLRGRDGNVRKAEKMFRDMIDWRESFDVENKVHSWRRELERGRTRRAQLCKIYGVEEQMCNDKYGIPATCSIQNWATLLLSGWFCDYYFTFCVLGWECFFTTTVIDLRAFQGLSMN